MTATNFTSPPQAQLKIHGLEAVGAMVISK